MVPPSRATRTQVLTAFMSVTDFLMGMGATICSIARDTQPFENRSSDAT